MMVRLTCWGSSLIVESLSCSYAQPVCDGKKSNAYTKSAGTKTALGATAAPSNTASSAVTVTPGTSGTTGSSSHANGTSIESSTSDSPSMPTDASCWLLVTAIAMAVAAF